MIAAAKLQAVLPAVPGRAVQNQKLPNGPHILTREPTREQLKVYTGWVQSRCREIREDPSKA